MNTLLDDLIKGIQPFTKNIELVGSRVTCNPPPIDTDQDVLVQVGPGKLSKVKYFLETNGFNTSISNGSRSKDNEFYSYKNQAGDINFILTTKQDYFDRFMAATSVAKKLNLLDKNDRVILFEAVIRGRRCDDIQFIVEPSPFGPKKEIDYLAINKELCGG